MKLNNILIKTGIVLISIFICLTALEIYLRFQQSKVKTALINKYKALDSRRELCTVKSSDSRLIYELAKGKCDHNSHGFYDFEYSYEKPENIFRIIVIVDSVAQGQGVGINQTFSNVLEKKLNSTFKNEKFEVITLAVSGYSTSLELVLLENEAGKYSPDLIIWSYVLNDPAHPVYQDANAELGRYFNSPKILLVEFIKKRLFYTIRQRKQKIA